MTASAYSHIYLSPHLDDVVLSCGGTIHRDARKGLRSLVVTIFAGSPSRGAVGPLARELEERWGVGSDPMAERRREDVVAVGRVGAEPVHLHHLDCVYRPDKATGGSLYPYEEDIFGPVHPQEAEYHLEILQDLQPHLERSPEALVVAPLAIGHHVDHVIVFRAALHLAAQGTHVCFYEDYPYAAERQSVARGLPPVEDARWESETSVIEDADLRAKQDAIAAYRSQISTFWCSLEEMRRQVACTAFAIGNGRPAENRWWVVPDGLRPAEAQKGER